MAVPSQPVIYEVQGFSHVLEKLPTAVGGRWKQAVNYTCLDASEAHLAVGSEQGFVYVVNVSSGKLVSKLNDREGREQVTQVKINEKYGYVAYGTKEGTLRIEPATKSQATKKYTVCEQEKQPVTALTWSRDEPVLYCGYLSGKLVLFHFSFRAEVMQATRLPDCGSEVVQLSACEDLLLISTMARAFLLNVKTLQITQVGRKDRKAGCYGGTFASDGKNVLVARPSLRVFTADCGGQVLHTSIFRDNIDSQAVVKVCAQQVPSPTFTSSWQFTLLIPWIDPLVVTYHEGLLWVLDPEQVAVVGFAALTHTISSICTCGSILYVLSNGCNPLLTRLTLSDGFMEGKQRGVVTSPQNGNTTTQQGGDGQGDKMATTNPQQTPEGPVEDCPSFGGVALSDVGTPAEVKTSEQAADVQCIPQALSPPDTVPGTPEDTKLLHEPQTSPGAPGPQTVPLGTNETLLQATPDGVQQGAVEEALGQGEDGRTTIKGKLKPIFSNLLHGRASNEGVVSGLKDMLKPNMTLITGLLHKDPEVPPAPVMPAAPSVQLDEKELERIKKMATAEEEESLHVRVGGSGDQKKKSRKTKQRTHKSSHHSHTDVPTTPLEEPPAMLQASDVGTGTVSRAGPPEQDLSVTTPTSQQILMEHRHVEQGSVRPGEQGSVRPGEQGEQALQSSLDYTAQQINSDIRKQTDAKDLVQGQVLEPVLDIQGQVLEPVLDIQGQVLEPVLDIQGQVLEPVLDIPVQMLEPVLDVQGQVLEPVLDSQRLELVTKKTLEPVPDPATGNVNTPTQVWATHKNGMQSVVTTQPPPVYNPPAYSPNPPVEYSPNVPVECSPTKDQCALEDVPEKNTFDNEISVVSKEPLPPPQDEGAGYVPLPKESPPSNEDVESLKVDEDTKSDWRTKSTTSFSDPLSSQPSRRPYNTEDNPLYLQDSEVGGVSDDSCCHDYGAGKGAWLDDSPQMTHPIQVTQSGNSSNKKSKVASSLQDIGSSPQDDFIDPLNPCYESSQDHVVTQRVSVEDSKTPPQVTPDLLQDYVITEYPKAVPKNPKVVHKARSPTADIWCQLTNPSSKHHVQCLCISDQLVWAIDSKGTYYSPIVTRETTWQMLNKPVTFIATSASGKVVWGIHKNVAVARTGLSATHPAGQNWKATTKSSMAVKMLAVDENSVWVLKNDGKVIQRRGVSPLVPDGNGWTDITGTEVIAFSFIACCNKVVWALDLTGRPYVRTGISSGNISGSGWAAAKSPPLSTVSITSSGVVWVIDKEGMLGFRTGATPERPEGKGKWWEVTISTQAPAPLVHRLRTVEAVTSLLTSTEQHSIVAVNAATKAGVCVLDSTNKLHACWRSVTGYHYKKASKDGMFEVTIWTKVSTGHVAKWLVRYDGYLYCLTSASRLTSIELPSTVQHIATSPSCIWIVASDDIWSRQGMTDESPEGISWDYIELSTMLRDRKIRHIACSENAAWVVDNTGVPHFRFGVHPREKGTGMSPAWIPVEGNPKPFVYMAVSPDSLVVWACDEDGCAYARTHVTKDFPVGIKWEPVQPELVQKLCAANGMVFAISKKGELLSRIGITEANPIGNYWRKVPGKNYTFISTTPSGEIWVIDADGGVFVQKSMTIAVSSELSSCDSKDFEDGPEASETNTWEVL